MDKVIFLVGALGPIMTLPQLYDIWIMRNAEGVSVVSWGSYFVFSIAWIIYGAVHREKVLIFTYSLWFVLNGLVFLGAILYG